MPTPATPCRGTASHRRPTRLHRFAPRHSTPRRRSSHTAAVGQATLPLLVALAAVLLAAMPGAALAQEPTPPAASPAPAPAPAEADAPYLWRELASGVWAAVQPDAFHFRESNSLVVAGPRATLVVDAQGDPETVAWLVERAARPVAETGGGPVRYLVHTHWHGDHTQGSAAWIGGNPDLRIVGHRTLRRDVPGRTAPALAEDAGRLRGAIAAAEERLAAGLGDDGEPLDGEEKVELAAALERARARAARMEALEIPLPDLGVTERLEIDLGGIGGGQRVAGASTDGGDAAGAERTGAGSASGVAEAGTESGDDSVPEADVVLLHLPGHTEGDLVVWLPRQRILASGDLFDALPFGGHGTPARWIGSLEALAELPFETVVPGHGPVLEGDAARTHLDRVSRWLRFLVAEAEAAVARGDGEEAALAALAEGAEWRRWRDELTSWPGDEDRVARFGRAFDAFAGETLAAAYREAAGDPAVGPEPD